MNSIIYPFDAHCHIEAISSANSMQKLAVCSINLQDIKELYEIRKNNPNIKIGIGLHPWQVTNNINLTEFSSKLMKLIEQYQPDFIGECGLDKLKPNFAKQVEICALHCQLAKQFKLPIVFHCVRSYNELLQIITQHPIIKGLLHAFNANNQIAKQLYKKSISLGVGSLILASTSQLRKSITKIPLAQILIESDAPYMPYANNTTSSAQDCLVYFNELCKIKSINSTAAIEIINQNWISLYAET